MIKRTWHEDARKRLVGARIAVGGELHLLEMALKDHDTLRAQLARAEKVIEDIKKALDLDGSAHARHNLDGAYIDLERQGADKICLKTLRRVRNQLGEIEQTLAEYDRPSAPLDGRPVSDPSPAPADHPREAE